MQCKEEPDKMVIVLDGAGETALTWVGDGWDVVIGPSDPQGPQVKFFAIALALALNDPASFGEMEGIALRFKDEARKRIRESMLGRN